MDDWDTTWNCQSGRLFDLEAAVLYDPWEDIYINNPAEPV